MTLYRRNNNIYIVDTSNKFPTRIKVEKGQRFRLQRDDFISIGLDQDIVIAECIGYNDALEYDEGDENGPVTNIRWVPEGVSNFLTQNRTDPSHKGEPKLVLEYKGGDLDGC